MQSHGCSCALDAKRPGHNRSVLVYCIVECPCRMGIQAWTCMPRLWHDRLVVSFAMAACLRRNLVKHPFCCILGDLGQTSILLYSRGSWPNIHSFVLKGSWPNIHSFVFKGILAKHPCHPCCTPHNSCSEKRGTVASSHTEILSQMV